METTGAVAFRNFLMFARSANCPSQSNSRVPEKERMCGVFSPHHIQPLRLGVFFLLYCARLVVLIPWKRTKDLTACFRIKITCQVRDSEISLRCRFKVNLESVAILFSSTRTMTSRLWLISGNICMYWNVSFPNYSTAWPLWAHRHPKKCAKSRSVLVLTKRWFLPLEAPFQFQRMSCHQILPHTYARSSTSSTSAMSLRNVQDFQPTARRNS